MPSIKDIKKIKDEFLDKRVKTIKKALELISDGIL